MHPVDVLELLADGVDLAEAVHRALEHHRDLLPAQLAQGLFVAGEQVGVVEPDVPLGLAGLFRQKAQKGVIMVDLPEPDSPMMPRLSPASTEKET